MITSKSSLVRFREWTMKSKVLTILLLLFGSTVSYAQSTEYVVFGIEGPFEKLTLGQVLKEGDLIELPAGVEVSLLGKSGVFTLLQGPLKAKVTNESSNEQSEKGLSLLAKLMFDKEKFVPIVGATQLVKLLLDEETYVPTVGATRSLNDQAVIKALLAQETALKPWSPVLSQADNYCLKLEQPVIFRSSDGNELTITLISDTAESYQITWPADAQALDLNEYLDSSNKHLTASVSNRLKPIAIHTLEVGQMTLIEKAVWMAKQNCQYQALQLLVKGE